MQCSVCIFNAAELDIEAELEGKYTLHNSQLVFQAARPLSLNLQKMLQVSAWAYVSLCM